MKPFLLLHETGYSYLDWQKATYAFLEDGNQNLEPEVSEEFECEANVLPQRSSFSATRSPNLPKICRLHWKHPVALQASLEHRSTQQCAVLRVQPRVVV